MRRKKQTIETELIGKTIQAVKIERSEDQPNMELQFTDGTTFSFLVEARPICEIAFFYSAKDGDEMRQELTE